MMGAASFRKALLVPAAQQRKPGKNLRQPIPHSTNGVAECQIAKGLAARIQEAAKYPNEVFPRGENL